MKLKLYRALYESLSITRSSLNRFAESAPKKYRVYTIPKRTSGQRVIAHPSKQLKAVQKELVKILVFPLKSHETAYAYKKGLSIKDNAEQHLNTAYLLKMDFSDFFNSITPAVLFLICENNNIKWSDAEKRLLKNLLFWNKTKSFNGKLVLSVGAPSSPLISNFVMYDFDVKISDFCKKNKINYTRYADDITFSTNVKEILFEVPKLVKTLLNEIYNNLITINDLKTIFSSKRHNRHVTGVTISSENKLSIGRSRKRMISSLIHKFKINVISQEDTCYLQGLLAFSISVEPIFIERMKNKYTESVIHNILKIRVENE
ncbi:retron St85 family RNA-directed DNA polymerase [Shewanella benthica]|uniref:RNA-directed DNA polymerase n=1 Tax=Shewanella benthica KT99 TaxID=314608 RepID=A9CWI9_9GAMM|nr:retron St85 family RNA-directed DNA polymerase [Shewanella benthica]EDQ02533.1 RNA-directed DNA polymerase [Shewanella benthica KT99]